ncbi:conserved Plasmodium protein, unknown function [Plasmodium chabaudi chabaudi]|uniref:Uncharacterized protein n=1 Tax=Plasmodium chabaudi chabaudi TaxID=31271 RepID=A0A4V0K817_PLACU|nr:conserved Plasmodium protein, unknown function [Plasmodium chabaudi chabaudi]VTZ69238.1 conserved Plasmodium protein, unknown function [Plasmodium chabaudi chabaudi]|eukprot:XP_736205.2 conserved Plasmodium protein, unknown function [Plasmodium chabaudi chabaudi]
MNSKSIEILNLIEEKSFKKCEKLISVGLKGKKNVKLYLILKCLLHSCVNEIKECKEGLNEISLEDYDKNMFYILGKIYKNINKENKLIDMYEQKIKALENSKNTINANKPGHNLKIVATKIEIEQILTSLFEYCINNGFFKKSTNMSLKLYKATNDTTYLLYNCYLLYLNNNTNNTQIYNLSLNFLKNYNCYNYNKITQNFSFFLILYFLNIKMRNYDECIKILEYTKSNNFFLNTLQYQVYKLYIFFISEQLENCLDILAKLIQNDLPENVDYYTLYMDIIIYLLNIKNDNAENHIFEDIFKSYKNDLMYLEFFKKCMINVYINKLKTFPKNINNFWDVIFEEKKKYYISNDIYVDIIKYILSFDNLIVSNNNNNEQSSDDKKESINPLDIIKNKLENDINNYKNNNFLKNIYEECNVKIYMYMLFLFILKESNNYNLFYNIKNYISLLNDKMIIMLVIYFKIILKNLYKLLNIEYQNFKLNLAQNDNHIEVTKIKKVILQYIRQIYNFEKLLYILYKQNVCQSFTRLFSLFIHFFSDSNLKNAHENIIHITDDNIICLLVEMALFLDKQQVLTCQENFQKSHKMENMKLNEKPYEVPLFFSKEIEEKIDLKGFKNLYEYIENIIPSSDDFLCSPDLNNMTDKNEEHAVSVNFECVHNNQCNDGECKKSIKLNSRKYYIIALSLLKYAYNYHKNIIKLENEKKKIKRTINNEYINLIILLIYLNSIIGNFSSYTELIEKLNIKNIQLITYSPILFIHSYNYSYYTKFNNNIKLAISYYNVQQNNLKSSITKCFKNNSFFKINEIINSYFLNSSNIFLYFLKLIYVFKSQMEADKATGYTNLYGRLKYNYLLNDFKTKFSLTNKELGSSTTNNSNATKNAKDIKAKTISKIDSQEMINNKTSTLDTDQNTKRENTSEQVENKQESLKCSTSKDDDKIKNNFIIFLKNFNHDLFNEDDIVVHKILYKNLLLDKYNSLIIDNQAILIKYNIPSFLLTVYKNYDTFFYNHILYESLSQLNELNFLKEIKILNNLEANNVYMIKDIKTIYPMIILQSFYSMKGSIYITSHEQNLVNSKNFKDILINSNSISREKYDDQNLMDISFETIQKKASYDTVHNDVNFFISNNTYVSFDKQNSNYKNKYIFNNTTNYENYFGNNEESSKKSYSSVSPFTTCLTELFNYPLQNLYLNSTILNTVIYIFHKSFYFYSFDNNKKNKAIQKTKTAFLYLVYIIHYYELTDPVQTTENSTSNKNPILSNRNDNNCCYGDFLLDDDNVKSCLETSVDFNNFREKLGTDFFKNYELMETAYHSDIYNTSAILFYKCLLLNISMYINILENGNIKKYINKIQFLYNSIYFHLFNDMKIFEQLLSNDKTYQIINLSCLFKKFNYLIQNITIFTLIIQSIYNLGKKNISAENNMNLKGLINKNLSLLTQLNQNLKNYINILNNYNHQTTYSILNNFDIQLIEEIKLSYINHVLNLTSMLNNKILIMKSYI